MQNRNKYHSSSCIHEQTCRRPSSGFFANRFRSAACQKIQLPPGGSQEEVAGACAIQCTPLFREWQVAKSPYHLQIAYSCNRHNRQRFPIDKILVPSYNENSVMKHCFMYRKELAPCLPSRNLPVMKLPPLPIR